MIQITPIIGPNGKPALEFETVADMDEALMYARDGAIYAGDPFHQNRSAREDECVESYEVARTALGQLTRTEDAP